MVSNQRRKAYPFANATHEAVTQIVTPWLLFLADNFDWGYRQHGEVIRPAKNEQLSLWRIRGLPAGTWLSRLTRRIIASHLHPVPVHGFAAETGFADTIHYASRRGSGYALLCLDIDAHRGQTDALDAVQLLAAQFPRVYFEPSTNYRGFHAYLVVHVGRRRRETFNALVERFAGAVEKFLLDHHIESTIEIKGDFTTYAGADDVRVSYRSSLAKLPRPKSISEAVRLVNSPVIHVAHLWNFVNAWESTLIPAQDRQQHRRSRSGQAPTFDRSSLEDSEIALEQNAYQRMQIARFEFTRRFNRDPYDVEELCDFYRPLWRTDETHEERRRRARWCLEHSTFDPARGSASSFQQQRPRLLEAIQTHVKPHHRLDLSYRYEITDEDLAVVLWAVGKVSFQKAENPRHQFGCPNQFLAAVFKKLREDGKIDRGGSMPTKLRSMKAILEAAKLIECLDPRYRFDATRPEASYGKKYALGRCHWRYAEWCNFREQFSSPRARTEWPAKLSSLPKAADENCCAFGAKTTGLGVGTLEKRLSPQRLR